MTILQVIRNFHLVLINNECSNFGQTKNDVCVQHAGDSLQLVKHAVYNGSW